MILHNWNAVKVSLEMIEIAGIDHIVLRTDKLEQMLDFYGDILGCTVERELPAHIGLVQLRAGSALIDLIPIDSQLGKIGGGAVAPAGNNMDHFCLQLKPISEQALTDHLNQFGITVGVFGERYGAQGMGQSIYIKDPEGNTVELRSQI